MKTCNICEGTGKYIERRDIDDNVEVDCVCRVGTKQDHDEAVGERLSDEAKGK